MADLIRAALEQLTVLAQAELDADRIPGRQEWERALAAALYALAAAPPAEGGVVGPSDEDLLRLMPERWTAPVHAAAAIQAGALSYARVVWAAALLEQRHPTPVPVSERLPGDVLCWWYEPDEDDDGSGYGGNWTLLRIRGGVSFYTHWLPAHALPLPAGEVQP